MNNPLSEFVFYAEFDATKNEAALHGERQVNVIAVPLDENGKPYLTNGNMVEALCAAYEYDNSPTHYTLVDPNYLEKECTKVNKDAVKTLHPQLWQRIMDDALSEHNKVHKRQRHT